NKTMLAAPSTRSWQLAAASPVVEDGGPYAVVVLDVADQHRAELHQVAHLFIYRFARRSGDDAHQPGHLHLAFGYVHLRVGARGHPLVAYLRDVRGDLGSALGEPLQRFLDRRLALPGHDQVSS